MVRLHKHVQVPVVKLNTHGPSTIVTIYLAGWVAQFWGSWLSWWKQYRPAKENYFEDSQPERKRSARQINCSVMKLCQSSANRYAFHLILWAQISHGTGLASVSQWRTLGTGFVVYESRLFSPQKRPRISKEALSGLPKKSSFLTLFCHRVKRPPLFLCCFLSFAASDR